MASHAEQRFRRRCHARSGGGLAGIINGVIIARGTSVDRTGKATGAMGEADTTGALN